MTPSTAPSRTRQMIYIALLCAQGVIIGLLERAIPFPFAFAPGAKLGLANIITLVSLFTMPISDSFLLVWMRLLLTTLLGGTLSTFLYSATGSLLAWLGMLIIKQLGERRVSMIGISASGGILFNVGQLAVASLIAQSWTVMLYLPILSFIGILAGIAVGITANFLFEHVDTLARLRYDYQQHLERNQL
ncbi:heptaprenyl diphosphate synthase subunit I [Furfurilactobacillus curtus]|uniref:Heptaprenyl diphosphate synthase subunit I n=1 Tax=Furfurilactobacillus curtus TaxID=1746200 RepID=A0ABQ5JML9_9LACO